MLWLKCCPRCVGDLYESKDWFGDYIGCVQCGYHLTEEEEARFVSRPVHHAAASRALVAVEEPLAAEVPGSMQHIGGL